MGFPHRAGLEIAMIRKYEEQYMFNRGRYPTPCERVRDGERIKEGSCYLALCGRCGADVWVRASISDVLSRAGIISEYVCIQCFTDDDLKYILTHKRMIE